MPCVNFVRCIYLVLAVIVIFLLSTLLHIRLRAPPLGWAGQLHRPMSPPHPSPSRWDGNKVFGQCWKCRGSKGNPRVKDHDIIFIIMMIILISRISQSNHLQLMVMGLRYVEVEAIFEQLKMGKETLTNVFPLVIFLDSRTKPPFEVRPCEIAVTSPRTILHTETMAPPESPMHLQATT